MFVLQRRPSRPVLIIALFLSVLLIGAGLLALFLSRSATAVAPRAPFDLSKLQLSFEPNVGQTGNSVQYLAHAPGASLFFATDGVTLAINTTGSASGQGNAANTGAYVCPGGACASILRA